MIIYLHMKKILWWSKVYFALVVSMHHCAVPEISILLHWRDHWNFLGVGDSITPKNLKECMKIFRGVGWGRVLDKIPSVLGRYGYFLEVHIGLWCMLMYTEFDSSHTDVLYFDSKALLVTICDCWWFTGSAWMWAVKELILTLCLFEKFTWEILNSKAEKMDS